MSCSLETGPLAVAASSLGKGVWVSGFSGGEGETGNCGLRVKQEGKKHPVPVGSGSDIQSPGRSLAHAQCPLPAETRLLVTEDDGEAIIRARPAISGN